VLVETFSQFDAGAVRRSGLLPFWLVFNTYDSLAVLRAVRSEFPPGLPVFFAALATFSLTPDMVPWEAWMSALEGLQVHPLGARPSHYPSDTWAVVNWQKPLHAWADAHPQPLPPSLSPETLARLAAALPGLPDPHAAPVIPPALLSTLRGDLDPCPIKFLTPR
jgi:hypothetical protein